MPDGSSSAAPVIRPGPSSAKNLWIALLCRCIHGFHHLGIQQDDQAFLDHPSDFGENFADLVLVVHYRDHHRLIVGHAEQPFVMNLAVASEAHHAHLRRGAREANWRTRRMMASYNELVPHRSVS